MLCCWLFFRSAHLTCLTRHAAVIRCRSRACKQAQRATKMCSAGTIRAKKRTNERRQKREAHTPTDRHTCTHRDRQRERERVGECKIKRVVCLALPKRRRRARKEKNEEGEDCIRCAKKLNVRKRVKERRKKEREEEETNCRRDESVQEEARRAKSLRHSVFPGGHPSKY